MMVAKLSLLSLSLSFLLLFHGCIANKQQQNECQFRQLSALEPNDVIQAEGGVTEFWDSNDQQFQCAGVSVIRHRIQPRGLLLPSYVNSPLLAYVEQGRGIQSVMLPGCPETYQSSQEGRQEREGRQEEEERQEREGRQEGRQEEEERQEREGRQEGRQEEEERQEREGRQEGHQEEEERQEREGRQEGRQEKEGRRSQQDRNQKIQNFKQGDVIAIPTGAAHWIYNNGETELIVVLMFDTSNNQNQLDQEHRRFFLAGNHPQQGQEGGHWRHKRGQEEQQQRHGAGNVFKGFAVKILAEAFNVDTETARKLQGQDDKRGYIIKIERGLQVIRPQFSQEEEEEEGREREQGWRSTNGLEETICSAKLRENIDNPSHADFYNPQAGRWTNLNSYKFPILKSLQLSIARGVLHRNAMVAPQWTLNAHNIVYVTRGSMQVQIVDNRGQTVFNDQLKQGQIVVVPQNFAVVKQAGEQGCRWVSFRTNDNAMINTLAGRNSALRAMPVDVIANSYQISREEAQKLKLNREETHLFSPSSRSPRLASVV